MYPCETTFMYACETETTFMYACETTFMYVCILIRGTNYVFMTFASETISGPVKVYFLKNLMFDLVKLGNKISQMKKI